MTLWMNLETRFGCKFWLHQDCEAEVVESCGELALRQGNGPVTGGGDLGVVAEEHH